MIGKITELHEIMKEPGGFLCVHVKEPLLRRMTNEGFFQGLLSAGDADVVGLACFFVCLLVCFKEI